MIPVSADLIKTGKPLCYCQLVKKKAERICGECLEDEELNDAGQLPALKGGACESELG